MTTEEQHETAPETAQEPAEAPEEPQETAEDTDLAKIRREAAGHRVRAREAEGRADTAEARLEAVLAHIVSDVAGRGGVSAEALEAAEVDRSAWFRDDGCLDLERVRSDVEDVRARFALPRRGVSPRTGTGSEKEIQGVSWADAIKR